MSSLVITGATGFIGRAFLRYILDNSKDRFDEIRVIVRHGSPYRDWISSLDLRCIWADLLDEKMLISAINKNSVVVHCAGYVGRDKQRLWRVNVEGTRRVVEICLKKGVKRLVYLSSVAVISGNKEIPLKDDMPLASSMDYGQSKLEAELIVWNAVGKGLSAVILRPAMVYGPGEPHMLPTVISLMKKSLFFLFGRMDNPWHLCGIDNLVWIMNQALFRDDMLGKSFICADEEILRADEIFLTIARALGKRSLPRIPEFMLPFLIRLPKIGNLVKFMRKARIYDISQIKRIGYKDIISPQEGLKRAVELAGANDV